MKPIYRYVICWNLWREHCGLFYDRYRCFLPREDFSVQYEQFFGPIFRIYATRDCHTTGSALEYVDPSPLHLLT
jgi:hypothetical protein